MTITEVLDHFGGINETAKALGITYQAVKQWTDRGQVPEGRQFQIQLLTGGALVADARQSA